MLLGTYSYFFWSARAHRADHRAGSRAIFARGALHAAAFASAQTPVCTVWMMCLPEPFRFLQFLNHNANAQRPHSGQPLKRAFLQEA